MKKSKIFCFDIDGVIVTKVKSLNYEIAKPKISTINIINDLYQKGHKIILFTARGYVTGKKLYRMTKKQMDSFGVKYHILIMGKPNADYYIDDKLVTLKKLKLKLKNKKL